MNCISFAIGFVSFPLVAGWIAMSLIVANDAYRGRDILSRAYWLGEKPR